MNGQHPGLEPRQLRTDGLSRSAPNRPANFGPEREFLLLAARPVPGDDARKRLVELSGAVHWELLLDAAAFHLLEPALWRQVADLPGMPADFKSRLRAANVAGSAHNMRLMAAAVQLHGRLQQAGLAALIFKGPILAQEAYGGASGRGFSDVDLLVRRGDAARAIELLEAEGYRPLFPLTGRWTNRYLRRFYELTFRDVRGAMVDLHWSLIDPQFSFCPTENATWQDIRTVELQGAFLPTLSVDMTARYLCVHVAKHHWDRVGWLADVAHWKRRNSHIDWARLGSEPATGRFVLITLGLIQRLFGESLTGDVETLIARDPIVLAQIDAVDKRLLRSPRQAVTRSAHWRTEFARAMPRAGDRWRSFFSTLFRPSVKEWLAVPLPEWLSPLYAVIRPCRLVWKRLLRRDAETF